MSVKRLRFLGLDGVITLFEYYFSAHGKGNAVGNVVVRKGRYNVCKYLQIKELEKASARRN